MIFSLQQYNSLQLCQKAILLAENSVFIMSLIEEGIIYSLYYFCSFYVEVLLNTDISEMIDITAFKDGTPLDKYLNCIVLHGF